MITDRVKLLNLKSAHMLMLALAASFIAARATPGAEAVLDDDERPSAAATLPLKLAYKGREANAAWRKEAEARIERSRKADLSLTVTDAAGQPLPDAELSIKLKRHSFGWGAATRLPIILEKKPAKPAPGTPVFDK